MSDMFEYLEAQAEEENLPFKNAAIIAIDRAERNFESFVASAKGEKEFWARIAYIQDEILKIAQDACEEYGYDDHQHVAKLILGQLELVAGRNSDSADTANVGDIEHQDLKPMDPDGYYTEPTVALNPNSAGDNMKNTNPAIPELTPDDHQSPIDQEWPWDGALPAGNMVDADKPMQPEDHHGDSTMTFPNKGQADPVTASKKKSNPLGGEDSEDYAGEWEYPEQSMEQIKQRLLEGASIDDIQREFADFIQQNNISRNDIYQIGLTGRTPEHYAAMIKSAAERMDFNGLSELMTPSEATKHLIEAGMDAHEAKDRIDWYVNHVDSGWAHKAWIAASEGEEPTPDQFGRILRDPNPEDATEMARVEHFKNAQRQRIMKKIQTQKDAWYKNEANILKAWEKAGISPEIIEGGLEGLDVVKDENGFTDLDKLAIESLKISSTEFEVAGIDQDGNVVMNVPSIETGYEKKLKQEQKTIYPRTKQISIGDEAIVNRSMGLPNSGETTGELGGPREF